MAYPPQPKLGVRGFFEQLATYALGLVPGFLLNHYVPEGSFVRWTPVFLGVLAGIPCALLLALPLRLIVRNPQHRSLYALIILAYSLLWLGPLAARFIDMRLDDSPGIERSLTVLELTHSAKGADSITLRHWEAGEPPFAIHGHYDQGSQVKVRTHGGFLGFDWVELPFQAAENDSRGLARR